MFRRCKRYLLGIFSGPESNKPLGFIDPQGFRQLSLFFSHARARGGGGGPNRAHTESFTYLSVGCLVDLPPPWGGFHLLSSALNYPAGVDLQLFQPLENMLCCYIPPHFEVDDPLDRARSIF